MSHHVYLPLSRNPENKNTAETARIREIEHFTTRVSNERFALTKEERVELKKAMKECPVRKHAPVIVS